MSPLLLLILSQVCSPEGNRQIVGSLLVGSGARHWDGGTVDGEVTAGAFTSVAQTHGRLTDAGYAYGAFSCSGVGGDGEGNGMPCLANPMGIVEIYGHMPVGQSHDGESICPIELYDMTLPQRTSGALLCVGKAGAGDKIWRLMTNGDVYQDGNAQVMRGPRAVVEARSGTAPLGTGLELMGGIQGEGGISRAAVYIGNTRPQYSGSADELTQWINQGYRVAAVDVGGAFHSTANAPTTSLDHPAAFNAFGSANFGHAAGVVFAKLGHCGPLTDGDLQRVTDKPYRGWYTRDVDPVSGPAGWLRLKLEPPPSN